MRAWAVLAVVGAQLVVLAWAGLPGAGAPDVEVKLFRFRPETLAVAGGRAVTWVNQDDVDHTVTSGTPGAPTGAFQATLAGKAASATIRFARPGVYPYFCARHEAMRGEIRVQ